MCLSFDTAPYINETFIYKNKACVYRLYRMVGKFTLGS